MTRNSKMQYRVDIRNEPGADKVQISSLINKKNTVRIRRTDKSGTQMTGGYIKTAKTGNFPGHE